MPPTPSACWHRMIESCERSIIVHISSFPFDSVNLVAIRAPNIFFQNNLSYMTFTKCITSVHA